MIRGLNRGQRVVLVVGLGVFLATVGRYVEAQSIPGGGWFGYAPETSIAFSPRSGLRPWVAAVLWTCLTAVWVAVSIWLLRNPGEPD